MATLAWKELTTDVMLDAALADSESRTVVFFKHSTRCPISSMALKMFERGYNYGDNVTAYYLDLIAFRSLSNRLANELHVPHESPQMIVVKHRKAVYHASHSGIDAGDIANWM